VEYPRSIAEWLEASVPLRHKTNVGDAYHCSIAADNPEYEWRVFSKEGQPHVELIPSINLLPKETAERIHKLNGG
jgi:hypothetical protein